MQNLFVYGTLKDPSVQKKAFGRESQSEKDVLIGYVKSQVIINGVTYSILVKGEGEIEGLVLKVSDDELKKTDIFETNAYRRIQEQLKSGISAWVYIK